MELRRQAEKYGLSVQKDPRSGKEFLGMTPEILERVMAHQEAFDPLLQEIHARQATEAQASMEEKTAEHHGFRAKVEADEQRAIVEQRGPAGRSTRAYYEAENRKRAHRDEQSRALKSAGEIRASIMTGPRGGQYTVTTSGEKHYVGNNEHHDAAQTRGKGPWQK
jgi:hypothetical protein